MSTVMYRQPTRSPPLWIMPRTYYQLICSCGLFSKHSARDMNKPPHYHWLAQCETVVLSSYSAPQGYLKLTAACSPPTNFSYSILRAITWSRSHLKNLTVAEVVKKFPAFYGTRRFITLFGRTRHWDLSWGRRIYSTSSHTTSFKIQFNIIRSSTARSSKWSLSFGSSH
jgi:hypothetical protein